MCMHDPSISEKRNCRFSYSGKVEGTVVVRIPGEVEQPASSCLVYMPYIQHLVAAMTATTKSAGAMVYKRLRLANINIRL